MKLSYKGEHHLDFTVTNPDESLTRYWKEKISYALGEEFNNFIEEVSVAVRTQKPGTKLVLKSKPITVTLMKPKEEAGQIVWQG